MRGAGCSRRLLTAVTSLAIGWSTTAWATTGLLPVDASAMGADEARIRRGVTDAAREVLKGNAVDVAADALPGGLPRCSADAACMRGVIERLGVDELAAFVAVGAGAPGSPAGAWATVDVTIYNLDGVASFRSSQPLVGDTDLKTLMVRTFDPAHHTGRLDVTGLADGDVVLIDGLVAAPTALVRAGSHTVVVVHGDGTTTTAAVDVGYDERRELPMAGQQTSPKPSVLPLVVGGVVGGVGIVGAVAGALVAGAAGSATDEGSRDRATLGIVGAVVGSAMAAAGLTVVVATLLSPSAASDIEGSEASAPTPKAIP